MALVATGLARVSSSGIVAASERPSTAFSALRCQCDSVWQCLPAHAADAARSEQTGAKHQLNKHSWQTDLCIAEQGCKS